MSIEYDFSNITLTRAEVLFLKKLRKNNLPCDDAKINLQGLRSVGLVRYNYFDDDSHINRSHDGTLRLTDKGIRYLAYKRQLWLKSVITPILITVIANLVIFALRLLLQRISGWSF